MAYPIMVTAGFAIIVTVAGVYLHERLGTAQWSGVGLIVVGVFMVASRAQQQLGGQQVGAQAGAAGPQCAGCE